MVPDSSFSPHQGKPWGWELAWGGGGWNEGGKFGGGTNKGSGKMAGLPIDRSLATNRACSMTRMRPVSVWLRGQPSSTLSLLCSAHGAGPWPLAGQEQPAAEASRWESALDFLHYSLMDPQQTYPLLNPFSPSPLTRAHTTPFPPEFLTICPLV